MRSGIIVLTARDKRLRKRSGWRDYPSCLEARSVRKAAKMVGVHRTMSFRWRHRFLTGLEDAPVKHLRGIAEADETFLLESEKVRANWNDRHASVAAPADSHWRLGSPMKR